MNIYFCAQNLLTYIIYSYKKYILIKLSLSNIELINF